jgi:hypothetical protein
MSRTATYVKSLANKRQRLYHCSHSVKNNEGESSKYVLMSNSFALLTETMCFLADKDGNIVSYSEVHSINQYDADAQIFEDLNIKA